MRNNRISISTILLFSNLVDSFHIPRIHQPHNHHDAICPSTSTHSIHPPTALSMGYNQYGNGRSSPRSSPHQLRTKRQERVGHVVRTELAHILHRGYSIKNDDEPIEDELRRRINIVHVDVSPDLRQARVTISVMGRGNAGSGGGGGSGRREDAVAKRRAYAWLVRCTKSIRHALAQRMKHMKASPDLTFAQVDVGAAVDVMQLIEKVSMGYKREDVLDPMEFEYDDEEEEEEGEEGVEGGADDDDGWLDEDYEDGEVVVIGGEDDDDDWVDFDEEEEEEEMFVEMKKGKK